MIRIGKLINEGEIIAESPSFKIDFRDWKKKARQFIEKYADPQTRERASKIMEKDALYIYQFETEIDDLEKQAIAHYRWQLGVLMGILSNLRE